MNTLLILVGKFIFYFIFIFNIGSGGSWPAEVTPRFHTFIPLTSLNQLNKGVIIVAGTNGKTTTSKMISELLTGTVIKNYSGANLLNGLVSAFIINCSLNGKIVADWAVLEVDENTLPQVIDQLKTIPGVAQRDSPGVKESLPKLIIVLLNLFRDQLDRYGEVDTIAKRWENSLINMTRATLILNADDPQIAYLGQTTNARVKYFGIEKPEHFIESPDHAVDSIYCPKCSSKLVFAGIYLSHIGVWSCPKCGLKRPTIKKHSWVSPLLGIHNEYNTLAAVTVALEAGVDKERIEKILSTFLPAFGRQEIIDIDGKKVIIFLAKNPAGFNINLKTIIYQKPKALLFVLNDRIPDGHDVSWIYDVDFEMIPDDVAVIVSGDRVYDMALRIKYSMKQLIIKENIKEAIHKGLNEIRENETLYILPTYSAMLEVRKILKGRKIL